MEQRCTNDISNGVEHEFRFVILLGQVRERKTHLNTIFIILLMKLMIVIITPIVALKDLMSI